MKKNLYFLVLAIAALISTSSKSLATPKVTLSTSSVAATNINQGSANNIIYVVKMNVTTQAVTVNNIQFTLSGTHVANDLSGIYIYYNASAPVLSGASYLGGTTTLFAAPHTYSVGVFKSMAINEEGYYIITANINNNADDNRTIQINGSTNPVVFGYSIPSTITNNQSNIAGIQTIQAADITLTTSAVDSANLNQGSTNNIVYITKMKNVTEPVVANSIQFTLSGTHKVNDLSGIYIYYNASAPSLTGASYLGGTTTIYDAPHMYSISIYKPMAINEIGYYIITTNISSNAHDNHTVVINGSTSPVVFSFVTTPNIANLQANKAQRQTIQAADITLSTSAIDSASLNQGSTNNIVYITKMKNQTEPVVANNIQFTLSGTHDNNDLSGIYIYYNASTPSLTGASYLGGTTTIYDAPHTYAISIYKPMAVNETGYYIITANISNSATDNHTIIINGSTTPVHFDFVTMPNIVNAQTDKAERQIIQAADITLSTIPVDSANLNQGSTNNIVYVAKMVTKTEPVVANNIQFTLSGSHDNNDLSGIYVYYNATTPSLSGASYLGGTTTIYNAPHTYSISIYKPMALRELGYYIITANITNSATDNHTIILNGASSPVVFGFVTSPNITNTQSNKAKRQTIQAADVMLASSAVSSGNILSGSSNNIVYALKATIKTEPVTINNMQFTLYGSHDNNDFTGIYLYYNATAPNLSGASYLGGTTTIYNAPHTYSINIYKPMAVNESGYYMITVNVSSSANVGHTLKVNGVTDPVVLGFVTSPNIVNGQTNNAGTKTIAAAFAKSNEADKNLSQYKTGNVFPNPANSSFSFSIAGIKHEIIKAQLTGRNGNVMLEKNFNITQAQNNYSLNISTITNGVYYLVLINNEGQLINKQQVNIQR